MATYKPKKKIDKNGTLEEVKIPIESVDGLSDKLSEKDKMTFILPAFGNRYFFDINDNGLYYDNENVTVEYESGRVDKIEISDKIPIVAGDNVSITIDEENRVFKINAIVDASGEGGSTTSLFSEWTTGTSGNLYLPSAGLYEIKVVVLENDEPRTMTFFVDWEESSYSYSQASLYDVASNDSISIIRVDDTGLLEYYNTDYTFDTDNVQSISYRKVNEQISAGGSSNGGGTPLVETTYDELKALRDGGQLVAGQKYRITDYNCTTTQENTKSAGHAFDIIVEALSNNTLSENASAIQHGGSGGSLQFNPEVLADSDGTLVEGAIVSSYYFFEDFNETTGEQEGYKSMDEFIAYTYLENNDGVVVPVIYKTDADGVINAPEEFGSPDTEDIFFYDGTMEVDGTTYDKWRKIELSSGNLTWDDDAKVWALTNVVVTGSGSASDPYFANCKLSAWEIKYCLDNDKTRFWWADETNGKGVIYYMKDEYGNECPYDFKSIQFKRWATDAEIDNDDKFYSSWDDTGNDFRWCYTFMANGTTNGTWADASTIKPYRYMSDAGGSHCVNNTIKPLIEIYDASEETNAKEGVQWLNNIVLYGSYEDNPIISDNYEYNYIHCPSGNKFGLKNHSMTLGKDFGCSDNTFGDSCLRNTFGYDCSGNTFGKYCSDNTFGKCCSGNTFGNYCDDNTFGDYCFNNIVDNCVRNAKPQPIAGSYSLMIQGVHIHYGVTGQFTVTRGANYTQDVRTANDVTITV